MAGPLVTSDVSLEQLLGGTRRLVIPHFQREYSWEREHATALLDNVRLSLADVGRDTPTPCFLGSILVLRQGIEAGQGDERDNADAAQGAGQLLVVDGQQRLITLTMLAACLRDALSGDVASRLQALVELAGGPRLMLREVDAEYFAQAVLRRGATRRGLARLEDNASLAHANIRENRAALLTRLKHLDADAKSALALHMLERCRFVLIEADDLDYAHQIFLSINERGKELSVEDIFQAELLGPLDAKQQARYAPVIGHIGKYRREGLRTVSRGKTFFSHYAFAHGWGGQALVGAVRSDIREMGGARRFVARKFIPFADAYMALSGMVPLPDGFGAEARVAIEHLQMLEAHGDDEWLATAMLILVRLASGSAETTALLTALDRYAHVMLVQDFGAAERRKRFQPITAAVREGKDWNEVLGLLAVSRRDEKQALHNISRRLHQMDKSSCRLLLLRIDAYLSGRALADYRSMPEYELKTDRSFTVEHLIPKGARLVGREDGEEWRRLYPNDRERQVIAQYLGNLTLAPVAVNKEIGQWSFRRKAERLLQDGPHAIHMNNELGEIAEWTPDELARRHRRMMDAVKELWQLEGDYRMPPTRKGGGTA
jgi:hypothetical protein